MIPHNRLTLGAEEVDAATKVINGTFLAQGKEVEAFENEFCDFIGYEHGHAVAVSSGSAALYMAIKAKAANQKINSVAIPAYSCVAVKNAVRLALKEPIFVDVDIDSPNIDFNSRRLKEADLTIACHMYGMPMSISDEDVIEDCAQSVGATINGKKVGTQTSVGIFSFYATKPITSGGEGGMIVSKDEAMIRYIKDLRDFDMKVDDVERFNFQMTDLQAAIGRVQLKKLNGFIERRRYLANRYEKNGISLWNRKKVLGGIDYRGIIKSSNPYKFIRFLEDKGVTAIVPIEETELLCNRIMVPRAYSLTQSLVSLPLYPTLTDIEQEYIIETIHEYVNKEGNL